jgi:predicted nuclease of restriction endonuclease-like RecB superfamily
MLPIFADLETSHIVSGGALASMMALVAWVLKSALPSLATQYRTDVFTMQDRHQEAQSALITKHEATISSIMERFDKSLDRIITNGVEERKETRINVEKELIKRDVTLEKVSDVLKEIVNNVRILSDEVRTLKQLIPADSFKKAKGS